ncbi:MAG: NMD3-related protein, partial [Promethearchaeota archaeon]
GPNDTIYDGFLCKTCYGAIPHEVLLPSKLQLRRCLFCGAFSLRRDEQEFKWQYLPEDEEDVDFLSRIMYNHIFTRLEQKTKSQYELFFPPKLDLSTLNDIEVLVQVHEPKALKPVEEHLIIKMKEIHCPNCARRSGGRFDAIVQIRIQHEKDEARFNEIMKTVGIIEQKANFENLSNFISKRTTRTNGIDLMVSTNAMARVLVSNLRSKYKFEYKVSKKLIGVTQETGGDLYRLSSLLRLVPVQRKDLIRLDGEDYIVKNITKKKVVLQDRKTNKIQQVNFDIFQKKKWNFIETAQEGID